MAVDIKIEQFLEDPDVKEIVKALKEIWPQIHQSYKDGITLDAWVTSHIKSYFLSNVSGISGIPKEPGDRNFPDYLTFIKNVKIAFGVSPSKVTKSQPTFLEDETKRWYEQSFPYLSSDGGKYIVPMSYKLTPLDAKLTPFMKDGQKLVLTTDLLKRPEFFKFC